MLGTYAKSLEEAFGEERHWTSDLLMGITCKRSDKSEPYSTYYKVLEAAGFEITEWDDKPEIEFSDDEE